MDKFFLVMSVGWVAVLTGMAISDVGTVLECSTEPVDWSLVFNVFSVSFFPALWGYLAGRNSDNK